MSACERALEYAKSLKIDESESVLVQKRILTVRITDSQIAEIKQNFEKSLGIRLIHKKRISSVQTNNLDEADKAVKQANELLKFSQPKNFWKSLPDGIEKTATIENLFDKKLDDISEKEAADIAYDLIKSTSHKKISSVSGSVNIVSETFEILNSNGLNGSDRASYISGTINAESNEGIVPVSGIGQASCRTLNSFLPQEIGKDAKKMCIESINPKKCDDGTYTLIFEPYSVGELLAFVFAANFNLKTYSEKRSCFSNMLNSQVAVENFNLIDDPHAKEGIGSKKFDEEGIATNPQPLIQNGIFKNTFSDLFNSFKEDQMTSANGCRPGIPIGRSADPIPVALPHNLKIDGKKISKDEIISDTKRGLLVGRLWYTYAVNPTKGDFSCTARSGIRIIEGGEIKYPGKSFRIVHNLPILLKNISAIGDDSKNVLQWASLPSIAPSIRTENIRITAIS